MTSPASAATATPLLTRRQINLIVVGLVIGMFMSALDQMIVSTAIRTIGDDLNGLTLQAWVTTAYLIAATISTPLYGKLSDIYGRKPLYIISISLFVVVSMIEIALSKRVRTYSRWCLSSSARPVGPPPVTAICDAASGTKVSCSSCAVL